MSLSTRASSNWSILKAVVKIKDRSEKYNPTVERKGRNILIEIDSQEVQIIADAIELGVLLVVVTWGWVNLHLQLKSYLQWLSVLFMVVPSIWNQIILALEGENKGAMILTHKDTKLNSVGHFSLLFASIFTATIDKNNPE